MRTTEPTTLSHEELQALINQAKTEGWTELDLSEQGISNLPPEISQLTNLTTLDLSNNQLRDLPPQINQLTNLVWLALNNNQLCDLPPQIGQLTNLTRLYLMNNQLSDLPPQINQLTNLTRLDLRDNQLRGLPPQIGQLTKLTSLYLNNNQLSHLPPQIGQLTKLISLDLNDNQLSHLPPQIGQLTNLTSLYLNNNQLSDLPSQITQLTNLTVLGLMNNQLSNIPPQITQLINLTTLDLSNNQLSDLPPQINQLTNLTALGLMNNQLSDLPPQINQLINLTRLFLSNNQLSDLPSPITQLTNLTRLDLDNNQLSDLPPQIGQLTNLTTLDLNNNQLRDLPPQIGQLTNLARLDLDNNPLNPALQSVYEAGLDELQAYLRSLADNAEPLYETKLVLVGEGGVGKTTLLKALLGRATQANEPTTHGVEIARESLYLPHPSQAGVNIQFNAWDFGGQEVYRVTHQFFFSPRAIYLLLWEPRRGVQQCQVEDWLKLIRLRVGDQARVIIVSTHCCSGERLARIDKTVFRRDYGAMIVEFLEVDSLEIDSETGDRVGLPQLKVTIAETAQHLAHVGMLFNRDWRQARDELLALDEPHLAYHAFEQICHRHGLNKLASKTLATLMHDLGYIVYYGQDEQLQEDVILKQEWLTKAIGFVLEDRKTHEQAGILPDSRLKEVWLTHGFANQPRYEPALYPFFLRLMEKYDVSYRLETGDASLVAQHVPQVRPPLPWLPEEAVTPNRRRLAMICVLEDLPPGLVPWMIVRTHDYATEDRLAGETMRLHWEKGMFLRKGHHGEAMLELRGREFHIYTEAVWPEYFMTTLQETLQKLITDNWPGLAGRYSFTVPCRGGNQGRLCEGRFNISALRQFLDEGDETIRCQTCRTRQTIIDLLYGFEAVDSRAQLARIEQTVEQNQHNIALVQTQLEGLESRVTNYVMVLLKAIASESKAGPRLFTIEPVDRGWRYFFSDRIAKPCRLTLWCEAEGCHHPVYLDDPDLGWYEFEATAEWVQTLAPYAGFVAGMLKTILPIVGPAVNVTFGADSFDASGWKNHVDLMKELSGFTPELSTADSTPSRDGALSEPERSGLLALHAFLRKHDPTQARLGLTRIPTYTGDYRWLCPTHYEQSQPRIPDRIE